jgi:tetratricopeptide (TPR) repeat protein
MPSTFGYVLTAVLIAVAVFCLMWWMLASVGDEAPWIPSGIVAGIIVLAAVAAREIGMRRKWSRHAQRMEMRDQMGGGLGSVGAQSRSSSSSNISTHHTSSRAASVHQSAVALRALQQRLSEAEAAGAQQPEAHLEAFRLCERYLANTEEMIRSNKTSPDVRVALHAGQERVRDLQKHHLLSWARGEAKRLTHEAQRRVRVSDKIETAQRAVDVIDEALKIYPEEPELRASAWAVRDFVASVKIAHWVELAERAAFRGRYARAIARYRDALFYASRADMGEDARADAAARIHREIELLRARLATTERRVKKVSPTRPTEVEDAFPAPPATGDKRVE